MRRPLGQRLRMIDEGCYCWIRRNRAAVWWLVAVSGVGCRIRSIRARENWQSVMNPPVGCRYNVQALVSFDTIQVNRFQL